MDGNRERRMPDRRRSILVHSRLQGVPALLFFLLVALSGAACALSFLRGAAAPLREACTKGHFCPTFSAMELLAPLVARHVAILACFLLLAGTVLLVALSARITAAIRALCDVLRASAVGDLSTPSPPLPFPGPDDLGKALDRGARRRTLERVRAAREAAAELAAELPAGEELGRRLDGLERALREAAP